MYTYVWLSAAFVLITRLVPSIAGNTWNSTRGRKTFSTIQNDLKTIRSSRRKQPYDYQYNMGNSPDPLPGPWSSPDPTDPTLSDLTCLTIFLFSDFTDEALGHPLSLAYASGRQLSIRWSYVPRNMVGRLKRYLVMNRSNESKCGILF